MIVPILAMILMMPVGLYVTGDGVIIEGSGSTAILWAVSFGIAVSGLMNIVSGQTSFEGFMHTFVSGASSLLPIATILLLALALGDVTRELGTGNYVAGFVGDTLPAPLLAPLLFLASAFTAFSVGSSWGTFAVMIPIAVPVAEKIGVTPQLAVAAVLGGGVFGDHCSPISDTTIVSSMASASDHIDHVRTQLPYALTAGAGATVLYLIAGLTM